MDEKLTMEDLVLCLTVISQNIYENQLEHENASKEDRKSTKQQRSKYGDDDDSDDESQLEILSRRPPVIIYGNNKELLEQHLKTKIKKAGISKTIDQLKKAVITNADDHAMTVFAEMINEVLTDEQKHFLISKIKFSKLQYTSPQHISPQYLLPQYVSPQYVSSSSGYVSNDSYNLNNSCCLNSSNTTYCIPRSGLPMRYNSSKSDINYDSLNTSNSIGVTNSECDTTSVLSDVQEIKGLKHPLINNYNKAEKYMIENGIILCSTKLDKTIDNQDFAIIRELKSKSLLGDVFQLETFEKSYMSTLVDKFPFSSNKLEILLREDADLVLKSGIFVKFAERNIQILYNFIRFLKKLNFDYVRIGYYCNASMYNGLTVSHYLDSVDKKNSQNKKMVNEIRKVMDLSLK